jgi:hypothetical protein
MKKITFLIVMLLCGMATCFEAKASVVLNSTNFPDANFRAFIATRTGVAEGGTIIDDTIAVVKKIDCHSKSIANLKGIEYFTALTYLDCSRNQLTALNVNSNTALTELYCYTNKITSLDVSHNTSLVILKCFDNQLTVLDASNNTALTQLYCGRNNLTTLTLPNSTALVTLSCYSNQMSTIDLSHNTALKNLWCYINPFVSLDVSHNTALTELTCDHDHLTALDVSHNTALTELLCDNNNLAALDLSHNSGLTSFYEFKNSRTIKVYSYQRSAANGGGIGYYVPLAAQAATDITTDGVTTHYPATKALATLIDDAGRSGEPAFDISKVVANSWGGGITHGTLNNTQVLFLDTANTSITYQYLSNFTGTCGLWRPYSVSDASTVVAPNVFFTLYWNPGEVITGVDGVESNDVNVYTANGAINIGGSFNGNVNVYNLRGQQVYCGRDSEIAVPAGMYVVKVGGKVHKVAVR